MACGLFQSLRYGSGRSFFPRRLAQPFIAPRSDLFVDRARTLAAKFDVPPSSTQYHCAPFVPQGLPGVTTTVIVQQDVLPTFVRIALKIAQHKFTFKKTFFATSFIKVEEDSTDTRATAPPG